ncbi:MAG: DNA primase [Proteobacteria bacterium]|nr:DNA primase [Pseudomonadota bacterium]
MSSILERRNPHGAGFEVKRLGGRAYHTAGMRPVDRLLQMLHNVRRSGEGWRADCPNGHRHATQSVAITEAADGRVLLHCFVGCDASSIVRTVGLELADLFPERIRDPSPEARRNAQEAFRRASWSAALGVLVVEVGVVLCAAGMIRQGQVLAADDDMRLALAVHRIHGAQEVLR